jgi:hypothetical protein
MAKNLNLVESLETVSAQGIPVVDHDPAEHGFLHALRVE